MRTVQEFLDRFNKLEKIGKDKYNLTEKDKIVSSMMNYLQYRLIKNDLKYINELRNLMVHNGKIKIDYPIEPTDEFLDFVDNIINFVENPAKATDKFIPLSNIYYANKDDLIYDYMIKMKENTFTHIPILEEGRVIGVFSENTLFWALIKDEIVYEKDKTKFCDPLIFKYCELNNHPSEMFVFINRNAFLADVIDLFKDTFNNNKRLSMVFITEHGKKNEKIIGLLTPWDVLGK